MRPTAVMTLGAAALLGLLPGSSRAEGGDAPRARPFMIYDGRVASLLLKGKLGHKPDAAN
ncbi:hypothetical protein AB0A70_27575 [Streptomyces morookaense]|uniref:hypothetical protein n=1 Tax=Streptomyces morookaense TaxID=1970 RepID=UPI0033DFBE0B